MSNDAKRRALHDASQWFAQLCASPEDPAIEAQWQAWHRSCREHRWAWQRFSEVQLGSLSEQQAWHMRDKIHPRGAGQGRRAVLKGLLLGAGVAALGWQCWRAAPQWLADLSTRAGELRRETLTDSSVLMLDTATALDVALNEANARLLTLRTGQLHITAIRGTRPLLVRTAEGEIRAQAARFAVRQLEGQTHLSVYQNAVSVRVPGVPGAALVNSGRSVIFDRLGVLETQSLPAGAEAWTRGRLVVDGWRLDRLIAELQRYRPGYLDCAPEVAHMRVSGTYSLTNINGTLAAIARSLPVKVHSYTDYWTRLVAVQY